ncbi:MAG TPA: DsrE/DsrF/DrsH-like family protein [Patescibacteria group bacterium]|nr:DsrE/DsrF/DrsH-like family protein [Patescibacteria group bacterium]
MDASARVRLVADPSPMPTLEEKLQDLEKRLTQVEGQVAEDRVALVVFSGDLDRVLASFIIATGAAAMGQQVSMFFTFWGLSVLKKDRQFPGKTLFQKMMALMSPGSSKSLPVSKMNYFGVGAKMLRSMMKKKNVSSLEEMISLARELGVRMIACEMSRDVMGIKEAELVDGLECGGVASFLADALKSRTSLFI